MADVFTGSSSAAGSGQLSNQVLTAYDRVAEFALREQPVFDQFATVKPGNLTSPGSSVQFLIWSDLSVATTALGETTDVDAVGLSDSTVSVTPAEYGNAVLKTIKIQSDDYLVGFDMDVANIVAYNMVDTIDRLARTGLDSSTNVDFVTGATEGAITASNTLTANEMRQKRAELRGDSVMPMRGSLYVWIYHPDVGYDLKVQTGDAGWLWPHQYVDTQNIYNDEVGTFAGFATLETARAKVNTDGGASAVDTYTNYALGRQALAKAESIAPHVVIGPVTDKLMRFRPVGWHAYLGYGEYRAASIRRLICASSIGANS